MIFFFCHPRYNSVVSKVIWDLSSLVLTLHPSAMAQHSLHDRRFMSQAGQTRYFARSATRARSARRGEEKNKFFSSPRLALRARVALRAKYRVCPAWLMKRLSCRLWLDMAPRSTRTSSKKSSSFLFYAYLVYPKLSTQKK